MMKDIENKVVDGESVENKSLESLDPDSIENQKRHRSMLRMQSTAVFRGWIDPSHPVWGKVLRNADKLQDSPDDRVAHNASKLALSMLEAARKQAEFEDKVNRLDGGEATENIRVVQYVVDKGPDAGS